MTTNFLPNSVIVKLNPTASPSQIANLQAAIGVTQVTTAEQLGIQIWKIPSGTVPQIISAYSNDSRIEYIEPDHIITLTKSQKTSPTQVNLATTTTPNDPDYPLLWGLNNTGQTGGKPDADIDAPEAWNIQTGNPIVVGVIDSGVDYNHPDLAANIWTNPGEIAGDGIDNDSNGYIDDVRGWDFAYNDNDPMDVDGHGTHVAGTIAAIGNNNLGVIGVAWDKAKIMPLRFLDDTGSGATSNAILAINYAVAKNVKITNNSWGGLLPIPSQALEDAIKAVEDNGGLFVAAAGNSSLNTDLVPAYPASYPNPSIISVASTDDTDRLSYFSNYGASSVDLAAPGSDIYSTLPGGNYGSLSGTSMASPHVAGAAALVWAQNPTWTAAQVKDRIMSKADILSPLAAPLWRLDARRLNIFKALGGSTANNNSNLGPIQLRSASTLSPTAPANSTETAKGETGKDPLTGGPGADTLILPLAGSSVSPIDPITDFARSEKIGLPTQGGVAIDAPSFFSPAVNSTVPTLEKGVIPVFTEANGALAANQPQGINSDPLRVAAAPYLVGVYGPNPLGF
jgi:subtilisin family serine protease